MNGFNVLKYGATGIATPDMSFYDRLRAEKSTAGLPVTTITGVPPLTFRADGRPLSALSISGNRRQDGTPTQDAPIYPDFVGTLTAGSWTMPISCGGQTVTAELSAPLRKIGDYTDTLDSVHGATRKTGAKILDGINNKFFSKAAAGSFVLRVLDGVFHLQNGICSHFLYNDSIVENPGFFFIPRGATINQWNFWIDSSWTLEQANQWLADQNTAGTPVIIYYALETPTTETVYLPTIPTVRGNNTLTVDTTLQPSSVSITGHIKTL